MNSTIQTAPKVLTAGKLSQSLFQSRDAYGVIIDNTQDDYEMSFSGPGPFKVKGVYQSNGLYSAQYVAMKAGQYVVNVRLLGIDIASSPYSIVVRPGEISAQNTYTTINSQDIKLLEAGNTYLF